MKPYVIEVTTFKYLESVDANDFWKEDAKIQANYTSKQQGYIHRESGYSDETNEVLVIVKWETKEDADNSMNKFMKDTSVVKFVNMIDISTMKMTHYTVN
nr:hypothetical protein [uncultured Psychroserpens sp.]